jgi:3-oxoacid CoA-transferase A subunit
MDEAVADLPDGISVMIGGFGAGAPLNLLTATWRHGITGMTLITNGVGFPSPNPELKAIADLIVDGRVAKIIASFTAGTRPSRPGVAETLIRDGKVIGEVVPQGTLAERIRAGGAGIPAFYTPTGVGTALAEGREQREFDGRAYLLERALFADVALVRAWKADTAGNLIFRRAARNYNPIMAMAAATTIVEVEQPIVPAGELDTDSIHTPGVYVHRLVHIPPGDVLRIHRATGTPVYQTEEPETKPRVPRPAAEAAS